MRFLDLDSQKLEIDVYYYVKAKKSLLLIIIFNYSSQIIKFKKIRLKSNFIILKISIKYFYK